MNAAIEDNVYTASIEPKKPDAAGAEGLANTKAGENDLWQKSLTEFSKEEEAPAATGREKAVAQALPDDFWNSSLKDIITEDAGASAGVESAPDNDAGHEAGLPKGLSREDYEKAIDYAKLTYEVYDFDDKLVADAGLGLFSGIDDIKNTDLSADNYTKLDSEGSLIDWWGTQGLDFGVFENKDSGDLVVSFRGTEPLSPVDFVEDAEQLFGKSEQYEQAVEFARELSAKVDQYNLDNNLTGDDAKQLSFTGHSLGGGLATASALATGREATVFVAAGLSPDTIDNLDLDVGNADKVTNFNVEGDWLVDYNGKQDNSTLGSGFAGLVPETIQYGDTYWLQGVNEQADFGGPLVPDNNIVAKTAESVLNHAWHVFTHQLENKNFL